MSTFHLLEDRVVECVWVDEANGFALVKDLLTEELFDVDYEEKFTRPALNEMEVIAWMAKA